MSSSIVRQQPHEVLSLRDAMDRLFEQSFLTPLGGDGGIGQLATPAVDMVETDDEVIVTATLPGLRADDLKITLAGEVLHLSGQSAAETERKDVTYHLRERRASAFSRSLALPAPVISDQAQAEFENGMLTLKLPKAHEARRKAIAIRSKK